MKKNKLLRRLTAALLAAVLTLSIALPVFASDDSDTIYINSVSGTAFAGQELCL